MPGSGLNLIHAGIYLPPPPPSILSSTANLKLSPVKAAAESDGTTTSSSTTEVRICVSRTCRRQGSMEAFQILLGIAPPSITVNSCGCLGRCGSGPNLVILPGPTSLGHCGTAARAADVMSYLCGSGESGAKKSLEALALRRKAEEELREGDFSRADLLLSQAIDLKPFGGNHIIYKDSLFTSPFSFHSVTSVPKPLNQTQHTPLVGVCQPRPTWRLCAARLAKGNIAEALVDVKEALTLAPKYSEAYICQGDVFMAMEQFDAAGNSYSMALELDPSIRRSKSFKARITKLQEK